MTIHYYKVILIGQIRSKHTSRKHEEKMASESCKTCKDLK